MCGFSGFLTSSAGPSDELVSIAGRMTETLRHRGPDDAGLWSDGNAGVALGHRRLSIIDLSPSGKQPMVSSCGRFVLVYNGEIYNFGEVRAEVERRGRRLRGHSDTEVMLEAIAEWGIEPSLERLNGMFAFAVWDRSRRELMLARDRLGIKPLYYGWADGTFLFGSELKALAAHPAFRREVDRDALAMFFRHGFIPAPHSIYRGIRKLLPASWLKVSMGSPRDAAPNAYWSARVVAARGAAEPFRGSEDEAIAALDSLLGEAVRMQMVSDVPIGAFLSGGIDSSTVAALMQASSSRPVKTFTVGFRESTHDESAAARAVATHLGTDHTELHVGPQDALELVPKIPDWYDEPFADPSQLPTYLISKLTRRHVTVSLSGDGGDELFAGYDVYPWSQRIWRRLSRIPRLLRPPIGRALARIPASWSPKARTAGELLCLDGADAMFEHLKAHWKAPASLVPGAHEPRPVVLEDAVAREVPDFLTRMQLADLISYLPDDILTKVDRASMASGLEARVPILDHRVVELAWRFPSGLRIRDGQQKWILRRVLDRYVPRRLVDRPKMGFAVPIAAWLRSELRDWAEALLDERRLRADGFVDPQPIRRAWRDHLAGQSDQHFLLWDVLMFESWKARWCSR